MGIQVKEKEKRRKENVKEHPNHNGPLPPELRFSIRAENDEGRPNGKILRDPPDPEGRQADPREDPGGDGRRDREL